ncbi:hypothetical protein ACFPA1_20545 [Neobacillus sp. GCM10023253]|uniref:hypothetical protein n=1 Tax=Neobacillus sp. GCM10023253 TaxID=3252644 RepID=UPI00361A9855
MAAGTDNKALEQLIKKFTEASDQTKELDKVISNFSSVLEAFYDAIDGLDEKVNVMELSSLSEEVLERLEEIKSLNELQVVENLEKIVKRQANDQMKMIQKLMNDSKKESITKIDDQFQKLLTGINNANSEGENQEGRKKQDEMLAILQRIESQTRFNGNGQWAGAQQSNEELIKLRRHVSHLNSKVKKLENDYEERIYHLENEIELLKESMQQNSNVPSTPYNQNIIDISDDDLPF